MVRTIITIHLIISATVPLLAMVMILWAVTLITPLIIANMLISILIVCNLLLVPRDRRPVSFPFTSFIPDWFRVVLFRFCVQRWLLTGLIRAGDMRSI